MNRQGFLDAIAAAVAFPALPAGVSVTWYAQRLHVPAHRLENGGDRIVPAASIIKLLIAEAVVDEIGHGRLQLDAQIAIAPHDWVDGSPRFAPGSRAPVSGLVAAMLSFSDNTAANALLHQLGFDACNARASALGLSSTRFRRSFYDWNAQRRGLENTTTARDSGLLMERLAGFPRSADARGAAAGEVIMRALLAQDDRETIPAALGNGSGIANKTGELPNVRHDVAIVGYGARNPYVVAILSRYTGSRSAAITAIRQVATTIDRQFAGPS
jgi:beta-lactamase class A